ncbi:hypothetical protein POF51_09235 [Brevibacillus sp. AG]|uniref:hypothetical protein n=1 Tax=Brevibacillus sp. AG TaxID=3020891 RepID=UPI00232AF835|nr:hypothetical protein [Brevibacillus sp. AG]MDC0760874.1 hypothetical protein [Brevibacillus sp. AG]
MATILIVEDEIPINELIKRNLQAVGHRCISVMDGKAALEEMDKHEVDEPGKGTIAKLIFPAN